MKKRVKLAAVFLGLIILAVFHHSFWWWDDVEPVLFGWMPLALWSAILLTLICMPVHYLSSYILLKDVPEEIFEEAAQGDEHGE